MLTSWYDKSHKYVVMVVSYDQDVQNIVYQEQTLQQTVFNGYHIFYGYDIGKYQEYKLYDSAGNELEHIKP